MPFDDSLKNIQTPGRLYALCKLVSYKPYTKQELSKLLQPVALNNKDVQFKEVFSLANRGQIIKENTDHKYVLNLDIQDIEDALTFRRALIKKVHNDPDLQFNKFTAWYMSRDEYIAGEKRLAERYFSEVSLIKTKDRVEYNDTNIKAWSTWAQYFGLGYNHAGVFIPNPAVRVLEEMKMNSPGNPGDRLSAPKFFRWVAQSFPELDGGRFNLAYQSRYNEQRISFALSMALRTLHDQSIIELKFVPDSTDVWYLHTNSFHPIRERVSEVVIKGEPTNE